MITNVNWVFKYAYAELPIYAISIQFQKKIMLTVQSMLLYIYLKS